MLYISSLSCICVQTSSFVQSCELCLLMILVEVLDLGLTICSLVIFLTLACRLLGSLEFTMFTDIYNLVIFCTGHVHVEIRGARADYNLGYGLFVIDVYM